MNSQSNSCLSDVQNGCEASEWRLDSAQQLQVELQFSIETSMLLSNQIMH